MREKRTKWQLKTTLSKMKNALAGLNSRVDITAETIRDFQDRSVGKSGKAVAIPILRAVSKVV